MSEIIFKLEKVQFSYLGKFLALNDVSFEVLKGQSIAIIGANGTGKSTLLQMLDGLIYPDKGIFTAFGRKINSKIFDDKEFNLFFRSKVGFVFQNPEIQLFCPTVKEDILFAPLNFGMSKSEINKKLEKVVTFLNLADLLYRQPHQLSIGEKKKVAIASVLIYEPEVIIFDEPTAGLDPKTTRQIINIIIKKREEKSTVITSTHDLHIINEIAQLACVFNEKKSIEKVIAPIDLMKDEQFLHDNNLMHIHTHKHNGVVHSHMHKHLE